MSLAQAASRMAAAASASFRTPRLYSAYMVSLHAFDGGEFSAYLAPPEGGRGPGIVVLQEIFGVNANMRAVCDWFAARGFVALCPDLFWRIEPDLDLDPGARFRARPGAPRRAGSDESRRRCRRRAGLSSRASRLHRTRGAVGYCLAEHSPIFSRRDTSRMPRWDTMASASIGRSMKRRISRVR